MTSIYEIARKRNAATTLEQFNAGAARVAAVTKTRRNVREKTPERQAFHKEYNHSEPGREKARVREKRYREKHPDKVRAKIDRWEKEHPESRKKRQKKWRETHPEQVKANQKKYREKHRNDPEWRKKQNAYMREWRKRQKQKTLEQAQEVSFVGI